MTKLPKRSKDLRNGDLESQVDPLMVGSVAKAFRILDAFDPARPSLSLTQLAATTDFDKSATQRFAHSLVKLGFLYKDPATKRFELAPRNLDLGYRYLRTNRTLDRAMPYLLQLSQETEETVNLTMLDGTEIVYLARFMSRHVLSIDVMVGTRLPAYCTAPGIAMLSCLSREQGRNILRRSDLIAYTPSTTYRLADLEEKIAKAARAGYDVACEERIRGDLSIAAPVVSAGGYPEAAVNIGLSRARYTPEVAEEKFAQLVVATAAAISRKPT
jgi:IclR family transcriptional regulator, pca regulon regulatory protein